MHVLLEVRPNKLLFAPEGVVEGGLGDAGPLDDAVDPDDVHTFRVEELIGGSQQSVPG